MFRLAQTDARIVEIYQVLHYDHLYDLFARTDNRETLLLSSTRYRVLEKRY